MKIEMAEAAQGDLVEAVAWYDQHGGRGAEFLAEFECSLHRIRQYPRAWTAASPQFRHCRLKRFPFGVMYELLPDSVRIVAVTHLKREPGWWLHRLGDEEDE